MDRFKKLEEYGIIGDLDTCALVGRDGSLDWCCFPHLESPSIFAAILDPGKGGLFSLHPSSSFHSEQRYLENTNVLQTLFRAPSGEVELTDFMLPRETPGDQETARHSLFRKLTGTRGGVDMRLAFSPCFNYARENTVMERVQGGIAAQGNTEVIFLRCPVPFEIREGGAHSSFTVREGETLWFILSYNRPVLAGPAEGERLLRRTIGYWHDWVHTCESGRCAFEGPWHDLMVRSSLALKLLTHTQTSAICAAPTTSLPEELGGVRNWDYRYNWLRDASFTVQAFNSLGYVKEAKEFLRWCYDKFRRFPPEDLKPLYSLHGDAELEEEELGHLSGYRNSRPVRIGNAAHRQVQLDVFGELIQAVYDTTRYGVDIAPEDWPHLDGILNYVCFHWKEKDQGIWEPRCAPRHYTHSKLMCWVALDRGIRIVENLSLERDLGDWKRVREEIREALLTRGFNKKMNSFVQFFGAEELDASSLLIPLMEFLPFDDPRVQGTVDAVMKNLMKNGFVYRYRNDDGVQGGEGCFLLCTFWLVDVLALSGRREEAREIFSALCKYTSPLGLLSEEIDPDTGELLGNYPQAYSHIGLINSALYLGKAWGKARKGAGPPEPAGMRR
ncbi:MAG: glycoside hydrolase family 15 protein [Thermodesulfovibrionales bacterium]